MLAHIIDLVSSENLNSIAERIDVTLNTSGTLTIGGVNAQVCAAAKSHPAVLDFLNTSDILLPDGAPIVWLTRCIRKTSIRKISFPDILPTLLSSAHRVKACVALIGTSPSTHTIFADLCKSDYRGIRLVYFPYDLQRDKVNAILEQVASAHPNVVITALGVPYQEEFIQMVRGKIPANIFSVCGGAIDYFTGVKKRAPSWMHPLGVEWVYRLLREPRRLFWRYVKTNVIFLGMSISMLMHCLRTDGRLTD